MLTLGGTAGRAATNAAIEKTIYGFGTIALIISNREIEDIMKIVKSLEELLLLIKDVNEKIKS